jgi:type II secretory pathway predicted ATPase ExeA
MYEDYYGFKEKPFSLTPDPKFLYLSESHRSAFDLLQYAIRRREGFVVVTGDIGTGKTTLCRAILDQLDPRTFTALVLNPFLSEEDLITLILQDFGVVSREEVKRGRLAGVSKQELIDTLNEFLLSMLPIGGRAIVIIDEAQNLPARVLEQIRILSNLETDKEKLLQVILVGQLNLQAILRSPEMRQLDQRVSLRYQLNPLNREETAGYVAHRLQVAGGSGAVSFAPKALDLVHRLSGGTPRLINLLCDRALLAGYGARARRIPPEAIARAAETLDLRPRRSGLVARVWKMAGALVTGGVASVLLGATAASVATDVGWRASAGSAAVDPPKGPPLGAGMTAGSSRPAFTILVGSYEDAWSATSVRQRLEVMGYRPYQVAAGQTVQQVLVGRFATEAQARAEEARLRGTPGFEAVRLVTAVHEAPGPFVDRAQDRHP